MFNFNTPKEVLLLAEAYNQVLMNDENVAKQIVEAKKAKNKKKKPDADGDGVPDWADKHPGKDDNALKNKKMKNEGLTFRELYASVIND